MGVLQETIQRILESLYAMDPSLRDHAEKVENVVKSMVKGQLTDPSVIMDNNVVGANRTISLTELCSYMDTEQPVVAGNATFYAQPSELRSPTSNMLSSLKRNRKATKKKMFSYPPTSDEYMLLDLDQMNQKVIMNADYGGSGTKTAAFYTPYNPPATTLLAQSIITTMAALFESFLGNNQKFYSLQEFFDWARVVRQKSKLEDWVHHPTAYEVKQRIHDHFIEPNPNDFRCVDLYIDHLNSEELAWMYYANNLNQFIADHVKPQNLLSAILTKLPKMEAAEKEVPPEWREKFQSVSDYNKFMSKEMFLDPYSPPPCIQEEMTAFVEMMTKYIYVEYLTPDSIVRLNNHKRNTVLLVDTDSNIINADLFVNFVTTKIFPGQSFGRQPMYNDMILVNVIAATLDRSVANTLDFYGRCHNMDEASRAELTMKNEFMFRRLFLMEVKKRYAASIVLREGNINVPFKAEIKGMDFIKAGIAPEVESRFKDILCKHILFSDTLELHEVMAEIKSFEREIYETTKSGDSKYLKQAQYKPLSSYATKINANGEKVSMGWSNQVFRGSFIWSELNPEQKINVLDQVKIVKLNVSKPSDLDVIKEDYPEMYQRILDVVYINGSPEIKRQGIKTICIPVNLTIPEWMRPLINYDMIISDIISSFRSILDALHLQEVTYKTATGKASTTSCMISL